MKNSEKIRLIEKHSPHTKLTKNIFLSFIFGALICGVGQGIFNIYLYFVGDEKISGSLVTLTFIFIASVLTGLGIFDRIARHAGAGTLVPVTGFSNSVTSEAMDSESEGTVLGVGSKIFTVAGPVILFGISTGVLYGVVYFFYLLLSGSM